MTDAGNDLVVAGGTVVSPEGAEMLDIAVRGERIAAVGPSGSLTPTAAKVIDARGLLVMPGGIDPHVHYSTPPARGLDGQTLFMEPQEFSFAAALGGNTTVVDFAFQAPGQSLHAAIEEKKQEAAGRMAVDYGLHATLTGDISFEAIEEIGDVIRAGIPTVKTLSIYPEFISDDGARWGVMTEVAEHGGLSLVHAEDDALAQWLTKQYVREGKTHGAYIAETRNALVEEAAIRRTMLLAERSGSPLYVLHISSGLGAEALREARARDLPFYGETLTPYLSFTADKLWDDENRGLLWATTPPIKHEADRDALNAAIADDTIQVVASDHALHSAAVRFSAMGQTIESLQTGNDGVDLRIPVLFHLGVQEGNLSLGRFVELSSTNAAKLMGLYPRKGSLTVGADADIMIIDPNKTWTVRSKDLHTSADFSRWEGWTLRGKVVTTVLRGSVLVENERFVGSRVGGRFLTRWLGPEVRGGASTFVSGSSSL